MTDAIGGNAKEALRRYVERAERVNEEKDALSADLREVFKEAKAEGFDVKALRALIKLRKQDESKRREEQAILDTYMHALGLLLD